MLINLLMLCAIQRLLLDIIFNSHSSCKLVMQQWAVRSSNLLLALSTFQEVEDDTRPGPSPIDAFEDAREVENMAAADLDAGTLIVSFRVANGAVVVSVLAHSQPFVFLHTLRIKTGQALSLIFKTTAGMATGEHFIAIFIH